MGRLARYAGDRFARQRANREALRYQNTVEVGDVHYAVVVCASPVGGEELRVQEYRYNRRAWLGNTPMCGPHSAAYLWLNHGPLLTSPPPGLRDLFDQSGGDSLPVDDATGKRLLDQFAREAARQLERAR
ncbi:hypothetical protein QNO07_09450 [Streptomyces sp. 549]|uniref:hypothetical protein n=1 Tax=Streptomyces sp. 549 TaxID=3049076 RepID=UPI0024C42379|nr:hypothetical protein [Streptomyces sp. 549]MDK1473644.1 hypothetical protein [Streptomyces sp. 549]